MTASCRHFGDCGGCALQDLSPADYAAGKRAGVQHALVQAGVNADVAAVVSVPPRTRRRAVFKIRHMPDGLHVGFHAARSHTIVDMRQCEVLTPELFALAGVLRHALGPLFGAGEAAELHVTQAQGNARQAIFDAAFRWSRNLSPALAADLSARLAGSGIARLTLNGATVFETAAPTILFDGIAVRLPPVGFLQPTAQGEAALQEQVRKIVGKAKAVADLFAGVGTFSLPLAHGARVHAVEQDAPALAALAAGAKSPGLKPVSTEVRDLFRLPLTLPELASYDAVVLDPPRAGAQAQAGILAKSKIPVIAYVSCDAASFARDAAILLAGGYRIGTVTPVDQFLWSSHIELVAGFKKKKS